MRRGGGGVQLEAVRGRTAHGTAVSETRSSDEKWAGVGRTLNRKKVMDL